MYACRESTARDPTPPVRLVGFPGRSDKGRVEVYYNGQWGTVCDDFIDSNSNGPNVICRMLGFQRGVDAGTLAGTLPILLDDVRCTGSEDSIIDCPRRKGGHDCNHNEDFVVQCY